LGTFRIKMGLIVHPLLSRLTSPPRERFDGQTRKRLWAPIIILASWWVLCFLLYVSGWPIPYVRENVLPVTVLFLSSLLLMVAAFVLLVRRVPALGTIRQSGRSKKIMLVAFALVLLFIVPTTETYSPFHFWQLIPALQDQAKAYYGATGRMNAGSSSRLPFLIAQTLATPLTMAAAPYFALIWFETRRYSAIFFALLAVGAYTSIMVGRDFELFLTVILVACSWILARVRRKVGFSRRDATVLGGGALLLLAAFGLRKWIRQDGLSFCAPGSASCDAHGPANIWHSMAETLASYASQGFEGLGHAFSATWSFGGGYSHSPAVASIVNSVFGVTHPEVVTEQLTRLGWSSTGLWSTGFAAIANDVPWVVVPLVLAAQGALLALAWKAALREGDWLSTAVLAYTFFTLLFMPLTLQLATSGPLYVGYVALVAAFLIRTAVRSVRHRNDSKVAMPQSEFPEGARQ
jgi:hypothetical protein